MAISKEYEEKAARAFGLKGPYTKENLENHKRSNSVFARKMAMVQDKLNMRKGGVVKLSGGSYLNDTGTNYANQNTTTPVEKKDNSIGQFGTTINPEYQKIQDEIAANKAGNISSTSSTTAEDVGITDKGGLPKDGLGEPPGTSGIPLADDPAPSMEVRIGEDGIQRDSQGNEIIPTPVADDPAPVVDTGAEDIKSLFKTLLKRDVGPVALKEYEDRLAAGQTIGDISNSIVNSEEYKTLNRTTPDKPTAESVTTSEIGYNPNQNVKFDKIEDADVNVIDDATNLTAEQVDDPTRKAAVTMDTTSTIDDVKARLGKLEAEQGTVSDKAQVDAITQDPTTSEVGKVKAAELDSARVIKGTTRKLQDDELVSGPSVDQARVETDVIAKTQAEQLDLDPAATIKGQLSTLYQDFKPSNPPAWADGAVRTAMATLSARGMGASSLAGQAVVQAVMESALPIAQADAKTVFDLGLQNLSNRQATVILAAQQRAAFLGQEFDQAFQTKVANAAKISDIANQNFTAETQIAMENAKLAQTVDLANLSNRQAVIMANAAQIANLEVTNLNNRQAAEVQNSQAFLQMDIANLNNRQKTNLFKAEAMIQSLFTDAAAKNVAAQFNAESENQVNQFYDQLSTQVKEFNATQTNAANKFNIQSELAVDEFNAQTRNAVQQFNASNGLVISQANAEWERNKATVDTAAQNQANQFDAQMEMQITIREFEGLVQEYRDIMSFAQESSENLLDRETQLGIATINKQSMIESAKFAMSGELYKAFGTLGSQMMGNTNILGTAFAYLEKMFGVKNTDSGGGGTGGGGINIIETPEQRDDRIVQLDDYGDVADDDARVGYVPPEDTISDVLPEDTSDYSTFASGDDPASTR